jgi:hypothetical protein
MNSLEITTMTYSSFLEGYIAFGQLLTLFNKIRASSFASKINAENQRDNSFAFMMQENNPFDLI